MVTLDELLARFPDNQEGAIDADDLRAAVTGLWEYTAEVQRQLNDAAIAGLNAATDRIAELERYQPYVGQVASDGTWVGGPDGWTSSYDPDTGLYTVNHDLGTEAYAVTVTPMVHTVDGWAPAIDSTTDVSFTYGIWSAEHAGLHGAYSNFVVGLL